MPPRKTLYIAIRAAIYGGEYHFDLAERWGLYK
jgi:hypothetical protein